MARTECVVLALGALEETRKPVFLPQGLEVRVAAGEQLVRIPLMPNVPDQLVARCIECDVQRDGEFNDAEPRTDVSAGAGTDVDDTRRTASASCFSSSRVMPRMSAGECTRSRMVMLIT